MLRIRCRSPSAQTRASASPGCAGGLLGIGVISVSAPIRPPSTTGWRSGRRWPARRRSAPGLRRTCDGPSHGDARPARPGPGNRQGCRAGTSVVRESPPGGGQGLQQEGRVRGFESRKAHKCIPQDLRLRARDRAPMRRAGAVAGHRRCRRAGPGSWIPQAPSARSSWSCALRRSKCRTRVWMPMIGNRRRIPAIPISRARTGPEDRSPGKPGSGGATCTSVGL